jgi:hypothetical protein
MPEPVPAARAARRLPVPVVLVTTGSTCVDGQWDSGSAATRYPPYARFRALGIRPVEARRTGRSVCGWRMFGVS